MGEIHLCAAAVDAGQRLDLQTYNLLHKQSDGWWKLADGYATEGEALAASFDHEHGPFAAVKPERLAGPQLVAVARSIAVAAHVGQTDKVGQPYITHPARVAAKTAERDGDYVQQAIAWLHDTLEDTDLTIPYLRAVGMPPRVIDGTDAMTKRPDETLRQSMRRCGANPDAAAVKRDDVADNADPDRLALLDEETRQRLTGKYERTLQFLADAEQEQANDG